MAARPTRCHRPYRQRDQRRQFEDLVAAASLKLDRASIDRLTEVSHPVTA